MLLFCPFITGYIEWVRWPVMWLSDASAVVQIVVSSQSSPFIKGG